MVEMNKIWEPVFKDIEWNYPHLYNDIVDWYPSAQMEITFKVSNGDKYSFDWISGSLMKVHSVDAEELDYEEDEWRIKFSRVLSDKMRKLGLSQDILSERTGISRITISKYMNGKATPSGYNIRRMAKALKCSMSELIGF